MVPALSVRSSTVTVSAPVSLDRFVPLPRPPADFSIAYGGRISYAYSVRDPVAKDVYVRVEVHNGKGVLLAKLVPGWVTTGVRHKISYRPRGRGTCVFTIYARDRAGNVATPATTIVKVR